MDRKVKFIMVGLDGLISDYMERYVKEGKMPHIKRLLQQGSYSKVLPAFPVDTPTNWTSFATGAWPGTHGIVGFAVHLPRDPLTKIHETLNTSLCQAEYIWDVAEENGMSPFILTYPGAWPSTMRKGVVIQGMHGDCSFSPEQQSPPSSRRNTIDSPAYYSTEVSKKDERNVIRLLKFKNSVLSGRFTPKSRLPLLEAVIPVSSHSGLEWGAMGWSKNVNMKNVEKKRNLTMTVSASSGRKYDKLSIFRETGKEPVTVLKEGQWSSLFTDTFLMENGKQEKGYYLFKLLEISPDGKRIKLYRSKIYKEKGWCSKKSLGKDIIKDVGPFIYGFEQGAGYSDIDLCLEHTRKQCDYYVDLANFMRDKAGSDFMMIKIHVQDAFNHWLLNEFEPSWPLYNKQKSQLLAEKYRQSYIEVDRLVGRIMEEVADSSTLLCVASDHGAVPITRKIDYRPIFAKAGLISYKKFPRGFGIDLKKTKAVMVGDQIIVNLKGREKQGIVDRNHYEKIRNRIIQALLETRDPDTGECPFAMVCRKEYLELHGVWGPRYGDVIPVARKGYWLMGGEIYPHLFFDRNPANQKPVTLNNQRPICGTHFGVMPNAAVGLASNYASFILSGPGIKRGYRREKNALPTEVAPTICKALGLRMPAQCEGNPLVDFES
jgi:predicted AlkP superfamily phosphohydrolase/phosphomutase